MPVPAVGEVFDPFLRKLADGKDHKMPEIADAVAAAFELTEADRTALFPTGRDSVFANRLGWARTYLKKAGLIAYSGWGVYRITPAGQHAAESQRKGKIDLQYLKTFPSFMAFYAPQSSIAPAVHPSVEPIKIDPEVSIEVGIDQLRKQLSTELLTHVKALSPKSFEELVVALICGMGYGGSRKDAGTAMGMSGDGGIDGVVREDRLGLDEIYIQAKRWDSVVGRPVVQAFVGALHGRQARRGVIITTSNFTKEAHEYAKACADRIVLIDGAQLTDLMFEYNLGVSIKTTYEVKELDLNYFEQF